MSHKTLWSDDTFEYEGFTFIVQFVYDGNSGRPWEEGDGHGPVREVRMNEHGQPAKKPGERILNRNSNSRSECIYAYDWAEACRLAKKDGWNTEPYDAPNRVERAVQADFNHLAGWVNGDWHYIGVIVNQWVTDDSGVRMSLDDYDNSLWRVENDDQSRTDIAYELAAQLVYQFNERIAEAVWKDLLEEIERRYWAERDVVTA